MQIQLAKLTFLFVLFGLALIPTAGHAQATRTWVSGVGDDANPCSRTAPCKTLAGAISKTAANGIINLIDDAAVGAVTITKSITIEMDSEFAGVLASGTSGVIINAAATDNVVLRGLSINGSGGGSTTGLNGVRVLQAASVRIEDCVIANFLESGIEVANTSNMRVTVKDTTFRNILATGGSSNANDGAVSIVTGVGAVRAVFDRIRILGGNQFGINAVGAVRVHVRDSIISDITGSALRLDGSVSAASMLVDNSSILENSVNGVLSNGANAVVRLNRNVIAGNGTGMASTNVGQVISFSNNVVIGNGVNGTPTGTATPL
jgi:hypothetical protein